RVLVDHRTDVYSPGSTLYELLTLGPAFGGADGQELLRQIAFEEFRPPRRQNKAVPAELETIVLKALEKNRAGRYATAGSGRGRRPIQRERGRWHRQPDLGSETVRRRLALPVADARGPTIIPPPPATRRTAAPGRRAGSVRSAHSGSA